MAKNIWALTFMVCAATAGIVGLAAVGDTEAATLLPLMIGFLAPTITGIITVSKADVTTEKLNQIDGRLNGDLDARIESAVERALARWTQPPSN